MTATNIDPLLIVLNRLMLRYANPGRKAHLFLFRLQPETDMMPLLPDPAQVIAVWSDEGTGLQETTAEAALSRCAAIRETGTKTSNRHQLMSRIVKVSLKQEDEDTITVELMSRSLVYSPKGDRRVTEQWKLGSEGWYSAYKPRDEVPSSWL